MLSRFDVLTDVNEPEIADSRVAAGHLFVRTGSRAVGEVVLWLGDEGRGKACPYEDLMGRAGRGLAKFFRIDTCYESPAPHRRGMLFKGALGGLRPPHKGGLLRPTARKCSF